MIAALIEGGCLFKFREIKSAPPAWYRGAVLVRGKQWGEERVTLQAGAGEVPRREDGLESLQAKSGSLEKDVLTTMT